VADQFSSTRDRFLGHLPESSSESPVAVDLSGACATRAEVRPVEARFRAPETVEPHEEELAHHLRALHRIATRNTLAVANRTRLPRTQGHRERDGQVRAQRKIVSGGGVISSWKTLRSCKCDP